jgi:hypothetical protein
VSTQRFRYLADPLCLASVALYAAHRAWIKPTSFGARGLLHDYLNDCLLVPMFLPLALALHRRLGLREHDRPPSAREVAWHVVLWSILFCAVFPHHAWLFRHSTADPWNAVAYGAGGGVGWLWWNRQGIGGRLTGAFEVGVRSRLLRRPIR